MTKYIQRKDGEGFNIPREEIFKLACCDCGLVHRVVVAVDDDGNLGMAAEQDRRATGQRRRHMASKS